jgi:ribonuclease P protein component
MLPRAARLTAGRDFSETVRSGRRAGARHLVVHLDAGSGTREEQGVPARAGLVVSRSVGTSVVRNRVKRRLRHLLRERLDELPSSSRLVVRALPAAAEASSAELHRDLRAALDRALRPPQRGRSS